MKKEWLGERREEGNVRSLFLYSCKLQVLIEPSDRFALKPPSVPAFLKRSIVKLAADGKLIVKRLSLPLAWIDSILVRFNRHAERVQFALGLVGPLEKSHSLVGRFVF